ncbi:hypothetical protein TTHERM_01079070 (macronuclear) [Tetrahymena thermophila SB210]|uniref:Uncharacterized protein n=1 Tax=Tetrahymena thermophila (strain SB210) TaxID=312017 RepID=Q24CE4_TETTS|nr:hypothetical protein TTHERM_01079070 [Tetrahymena thermophila SB210]EAS05430.2 hypothetical protein TTHERM_01079070 [Tetrahymena thermophila SB210]|eukprot:XP_001025675.2 hypothetical protein TTHERM_01079070 [Tetrahymena thermophila SB210]
MLVMQKEMKQQQQSQQKQQTTNEKDGSKQNITISSTNIKQNDKKFDEKTNIEYKRLYDLLCEENQAKQKKYLQIKNIYQNGSYLVQEKEKDHLSEGLKFKGIRGLVSTTGEKSEDIILKTIQQKKAELEVMENQIQEQIMYNQTLNFMALRTDSILKDQRKLVLKMEKLNKIVDKRNQDYTQILKDYKSQQQLTQFKMAEQVAQLVNKEEIYKTIDQNRIKAQKMQNEDIQKISQEYEQIVKQITLQKQKVEEQVNQITELNQVVSKVANMKTSFPYTFQRGEAMLYVVHVFDHPLIENILGDLFYIGGKENKTIILDSYQKIPYQSSNTSNNTPTSKKLKDVLQKFNKTSLNLIVMPQEEKNHKKFEYKHQVSNSFNHSQIILKDGQIFCRLLDLISQKEKKMNNQLDNQQQNLQKSEKGSNKMHRPSIFIKNRSLGFNSELISGKTSKKTYNYDYQSQIQNKLDINTIEDNIFSMVLKAKDKFLSFARQSRTYYSDVEYRFLLKDLIKLDSNSNGYMSVLLSRIKRYEKVQKVKIDQKICDMFQKMSNKFIQLRSYLSQRIQEKNLKQEKNKRLRDKLCQLKIQQQKKYNISDENQLDSNCFLISNIQNSVADETEDDQIQDSNLNDDLLNSQQISKEQEMRNFRLMDKSLVIQKTQSISPFLKEIGKSISTSNIFESEVEPVEEIRFFKGRVNKQYQTDFNSINILNSKLDTLRYTNIHMFTESIKTNNSHHPFESQFIVLEKTLGVVKRILQLMNTCLQLAQVVIQNEAEFYRDISQASQQFSCFNYKMQEFLKQQEGRFFGSFKFNQQYKKNYTGGLNTLLKQFKMIFPSNLSSAQKMFHSLIAHDVVVINFLDIEYVENELKNIKQRYDEEVLQFVMKFNDEQDFNLEISQTNKNNSWNPQSLFDVLQPLKDKEDKILNYAQKCLEFKLMDMIQESSKQIIEKAQYQCQQTTKNLFDLCSELYLIIFQILVKRKQIIDQIKLKKERESPNNAVSFIFDSKIYGEEKPKIHNLTIKLPIESRKSSHTTQHQNRLFMERKSILRISENDSQAKKNIISVLSKAIKEKKKIQTEKEKSPSKMKSDKFFVINEEGQKEQGSSFQIQNAESKNFDEQKNEPSFKQKQFKEEYSQKSDLLKVNQNSSTQLDMLEIQSPITEKRKPSILRQLDKNFNFQENILLDIPRKKSVSVNSDKSLEKINTEQFQSQVVSKFHTMESDLHRMSLSQENNSDILQEKQSLLQSLSPKKEKQIQNQSSDQLFRTSLFYNNGTTNPFQISLYKDKTSSNRSQEESRILISSLGYYKNKEKTINKVIQKKQIENGEVYDSFNSSLLTVDLKTKQNIITLTPKIKKINGFTKNQIIELQDDQNDVNLYKEAVFFEEERKNIKHIISEESKIFYHFNPTSKSIKEISSPEKVKKIDERSSRLSFLNSPSLKQKNNSLNNSSIMSQSKFMIINKQSSLSPSQLPSILKNFSPQNQSLQDLKVKVVKFPTVSSNKKEVYFKDQPLTEKQAEENAKQNIIDPLSTSILPLSARENRKSLVPPYKIKEGSRDNLVKQYANKNETSQKQINNQNITHQQQHHQNSQQHRGRQKQNFLDKISSNKERLYQQFNPETLQGEEFVLEQYKKDFLHLDQVYKATIQANKEKLENMKNKVNSDHQSQENNNNDILKKYYEPKKRADLQQLLSNTASKQFTQKQKSEEFNRETSSSSFKEEGTNKDSKTKINNEQIQHEHLTNKVASFNKIKIKSKTNKQQSNKKQNKNAVENKTKTKKKFSKKKSNKQKQQKNQEADKLQSDQQKSQNSMEDSSSDMNDSKLDIYNDFGTSSNTNSSTSSLSNVSINQNKNDDYQKINELLLPNS